MSTDLTAFGLYSSASLARILNTQKPKTKNFAGLHNHFIYASTSGTIMEEVFRAEAVAASDARRKDCSTMCMGVF